MDRSNLDLVVSAMNAPRLRDLTDPAHPDFDAAYIAMVDERAADIRAGRWPPPPDPVPVPPLRDAVARRAGKPRVPLGTPHCRPCVEEAARRRAEAGRAATGNRGDTLTRA